MNETLKAMEADANGKKLRAETEGVRADVNQRYVLLRLALSSWHAGFSDAEEAKLLGGIRSFFPELAFDLCTIDVFVEKAQYRLTQRSKENRTAGFLTGSGILVVLSLGIFYMWQSQPAGDTYPLLLAGTLKNISLLGLMLGAVYVLTMLMRAYFHESTILVNRRHSLRLGRLYLYLRLTAATDAAQLREIKEKLKSEEIENIFGWNRETSTAFKDIRGEGASATLWGQLLATVQKGFESLRPTQL